MFKKVLVPLDGSEISECTLNEVGKVASADTQVVVMRVEEPPRHDYRTAPMNPEIVDEAYQQRKTDAQDYIAKVSDQLKARGINTTEPVYAEGQPAEEILDFSAKHDFDLILMATHGRTGFSRWAMGSVADKVMNHSNTPVLLIRPESCRIVS